MTNLSVNPHLSEDERQRAADGSLDAADRARVTDHLDACADCAADVAGLTELMKRIDNSREAERAPTVDELWPEIRRQIEGTKVVALEPEPAVSFRRLRMDPWLIGAAASIAVITTVTVIQVVPPIVRGIVPPIVQGVVTEAVGVDRSDTVFRLAQDSIESYREEADRLLDDLKLERSRLAPETQASIDDDLKTVDLAIAELQAAVARDPRNPTLRAMLASSYRQKVDVLKKVSNAS